MEVVDRDEAAAANGGTVLMRMVDQTIGAAVATAVLGASVVWHHAGPTPAASGFWWAYLSALAASAAASAFCWVLPRTAQPRVR